MFVAWGKGMVFSSLVFIFLYFAAVLLLYFLTPKRIKNLSLLTVNLVFYAYGEPVYVFLMLGSVLFNFVVALALEKADRAGGRKLILITSIIINLAALGWFKYAGFATETLRTVPALSQIPVFSVVLPIGISFYTFQAMSYVVDVYRKDTKAQKNIVNCEASRSFLDFAAYISLFPQLIAGPIVRYSDVARQLQSRSVTVDRFSWGVRMFCIGLAKKVLLANQFALIWDAVSVDPLGSGALICWFGAAAYALQIYFDFGGYSDMARGLGAMLGFEFCINFNYPYISTSITEFWRRWHISLSSWFRDYVYIPLGGSRKGISRTVFNLLVVWMLTGLWHGAGWNFLLWGLYYGVLLIAEKFLLRSVLQRLPRVINWIITIVLVTVGWVFFASSDIINAARYLRGMFNFASICSLHAYLGWLPLFAVGCVAATPLGAKLWGRWENTSMACIAETLLCLTALILAVSSLVSGSYNPFLYFRF